ncbi:MULTISPECIES: protease inhibitor Inh/omp19 family protein [Pseudomonas syringae group]|uniref:protease inhibitor Inh/omp19 family protein n=1 Tax=Pseudomonas syringae group TaxID=136849 RepID=UPI001F454870|nr:MULTISPECIES: protease inhibitor Inh/omp19 family protein [Pseudomonas syringae group]
MITLHFFRSTTTALALLFSISGVSMATSLKLPSAAELSGKWRLFIQTDSREVCELHLNTNAPQVGGDPACAARWMGEAPTGWYPTPDGLGFTGKEGTGLIHLSHLGNQRYQARLPDGELLNLERLAD